MSVRVGSRSSLIAGVSFVLALTAATGCASHPKEPSTPIGTTAEANTPTPPEAPPATATVTPPPPAQGTTTSSAQMSPNAMPGSTMATPTGASPVSPMSGVTWMPSEQDVRRSIESAHAKFKGLTEGKNADYIPVLAKVDSKLFGIAVVLPNGEVIEAGDTKKSFSIQSISKVFTLARLIEEKGAADVEKAIGVNATGLPFNSIMAIALNQKTHPAGNPLVNAGAITSVALLPAKTGQERWDKLKRNMDAFAGRELGIDQEVYKSETATNQGNKGISYLLQNYDVIKGDPTEALDLYTRQCSVAVNAHDLAVMGATLASGGVNPVTRQRVISPETAAHVMAVMMTAGLYETTGTWVYRVGVPAKSGVGGGILAVVPGKYAVAAFSPPLDEAGNSVRAQKAVESVVKDLTGNLFAVGNPTGGTQRAANNGSSGSSGSPAHAAARPSH